MWRLIENPVPGGTQFDVAVGERPVAFGDAIASMQEDEGFRTLLLECLRGSGHAGYFWEFPPVALDTLPQPFRFVVIGSRSLAALKASSEAFDGKLRMADETRGNVCFPNLRGDAMLVVPRCLSAPEHYGHLAAFVRQAPVAQQHDLLQLSAATLRQRLSHRPTWMSTHGMGVPWLHVRLDEVPKYYTHRPFKNAPA
jgi:hypothetical protein